MLVTFILPLAPAVYGFMKLSGTVEIACLALFGFFLSASFTVAVVMGQEYGASHIGTASGISTGAAMGIGGLTTPLYGSIADRSGIAAVFDVVLALPLLAVILALTLPAQRSDKNVEIVVEAESG